MIYARGTSLWHGVRVVDEGRILTLCGRRLIEPRVAANGAAPGQIAYIQDYLCRTCALAIERSPSVVGA